MNYAAIKTLSSVEEIHHSEVNSYMKDGWILLQSMKKYDDGSEYAKCLMGYPCGVQELKRVRNESDANDYISAGWKLIEATESSYLLAWDDDSRQAPELGRYASKNPEEF